MPLTPIKVRGKNRKPTSKGVSKLRGRGRPLKSQTNSSASNTDAEVESRHVGDGNPKKRRKTRHARTLAPLESLPTEILQDIFFLSRNADLMFASKTIMHQLENSEHVKIEFCFSTLFWPIISGEVDPDLNNRPDPRLPSGDEDDDDDDDGKGSLLAHAQSRLLSCRFFTRQFFRNYMVKAYEKWNNLHASSHPDRVFAIPDVVWDLSALLSQERLMELMESGYLETCRPPLMSTNSLTTTEWRDDAIRTYRKRLEPIAFHPSARTPVKFFRLSAHDLDLDPKVKNHVHAHDILGFLLHGLRLRIPATVDSFDDLLRDAIRSGDIDLMRVVLWLRISEPTVDAYLPSDILRILVFEANFPRKFVGDILSVDAHEKNRPSPNDLLDPAIWAWAEKNGDDGEWLKLRLRIRLDRG